MLANPPFDISDWWHGSHEGDPPQGYANCAWVQHMLHYLKDSGRAVVVLANGSMSSSQNNEGVIRAAMVDADLVEVMAEGDSTRDTMNAEVLKTLAAVESGLTASVQKLARP